MPLIYVIDDDKEMLGAMKAFLQKKGFEVSIFFNWHVAISAIKLWHPQLILLDVFLSDNYDGLDLCQRIKSSPYSKSIPVIIISGFCKIAESAINQYGADDFIAKPIVFKEMMLKINSALFKKTRIKQYT
ncbi:MAG TPA: response regulator [Hanamia sp.]|nr:response regulator [Hanamia sp.]